MKKVSKFILACLIIIFVVACSQIVSDNQMTLTYNINGGSGTTPSSVAFTYGSSVLLAGNSNFVNNGYQFMGWNTKSDGSGATYAGGSLITLTSDMTLYVQWNVSNTNTILNINENKAYLLSKNNLISLLLNVTTPKSIYFIFSNTSGSSIVSSESYSVSSSNLTFSSSISSSILSSELNENNFVEPKLPDVPDFVVGSSLNKSVLASTTQSSVSNGDTYNFYEAVGGNTIPATCRKVVSNISTNQGSKTLNIWVADNCWINGGSKSNLITQIMVDAMADKFLKTGLNNDIYDWVTNVCGVEWGSQKYNNLLSSDQAIDILLCDIGDDNKTTGGTLGYFWNGNNFLKTSVSNSNEKNYCFV